MSACSSSRRIDEETVSSTPGDWLIVFSDGVTEAHVRATATSSARRGSSTCVRAATRQPQPQQLLEALFADVREFAHGAAQSDDITAMVVRYRG